MKRSALLILFAIFAFAGTAFGQEVEKDDILLNSRGLLAAGANVSVCQNLQTTAASVSANIATLTLVSSPLTAGISQGMTVTIAGFTGADTYFNGTFYLLTVTSTQIQYQLAHANGSASSNGQINIQIGTATTPCIPLVTIFTSVTGQFQSPNPFLTDGLGNYQFWAPPSIAGPNGLYGVDFYGPTIITKLLLITLGGGGGTTTTTAGGNRVCMITFGSEDASAVLANADIAPQQWQCKVPAGSTVQEIDVHADGGTPNVTVGKNHFGTITNLVSSPLQTAASGGEACANVAGGLGTDGTTTCSATLQNTILLPGDYLETVSASAGGTAKLFSISVIFSGGGGSGGGSGNAITCLGLPCVTSAASLTNNAVVIGAGGQAIQTIAADTTVTHALFATAGAPAFRALAGTDLPVINLAISTAGGVTGNLPVTNLAGGVGANNTTFWRGDGTWQSPGGGGLGTLTNVATTAPITGGPITTTGTIACPTCVTSAAALTANQIVLGGGLQASATLGSLGTTTTVLHGNAAGIPSFGAVSLTTDISGNLPVANLNGGTAASATTFWRGDGTWATPAGGGSANTALSNLAAVALNASLIPGTVNAEGLGSAALPFNNLFLGTAANKAASFNESLLTANRIFSFPDNGGTLALLTDISAPSWMTSAAVNDYACWNGAAFADCTPGLPVNTQSGSTYAINAADRGADVLRTNTTAGTDSIAQAGSLGFTNSFYFAYQCFGTAACTLTPATSTITVNGVSQTALILLAGDSAFVYSDYANYFAIVTRGHKPQLFAALPTCSAVLEGVTTVVTNDNTAVAWGATITGGGANRVGAYCDGATGNWTIWSK